MAQSTLFFQTFISTGITAALALVVLYVYTLVWDEIDYGA